MQDKKYIRNPKDRGGSKFICAQDEEDFAQEKLIQDWLKQQGDGGEFDFKHINRKGRARNTLVKAAFSLDQTIGGDDSGGSDTRYEALIAGSDGRDMFCGGDADKSEAEPIEKIRGYLFVLGFNEGEVLWLIKMFKSSITEKQLRSEKFLTDSE